jgi:hypothetical protein
MVVIPLAGDPDRALEGIFVPGAGDDGALVAPPHPLYGGSLENPVVGEIAWACQRAGLATLRFNWRGVGASAGERSGEPADADADYASALAELAASVPGLLVAAGYSFGAAAALRVALREARVRRLVLVAPPPSLLDAAALAAFRGRLLVVTGEQDAIAPPAALREQSAAAARCVFEEIPEADHFFGAGLARLGQVVHAWLAGEEAPRR